MADHDMQNQKAETTEAVAKGTPPLSPTELADAIERQLHGDHIRLASLTTIALSAEKVTDKTRDAILRDRNGFVTRVLKSLGVPEDMPSEMADQAAALIERAAHITLDQVRHQAALARSEASKLEGAIQTKQELLSQLRPPETSA